MNYRLRKWLNEKASTVDSIEKKDNGTYKVKLTVKGGFLLQPSPTDPFAIVSIVGRGNPETVSVYVTEKNH